MKSIRETSLWMPVVSAVLLALALPAVGFLPLAWIALVPLFLFFSNTALSGARLIRGTALFGSIYGIAVVFPLLEITGWYWGGMISPALGNALYIIGVASIGAGSVTLSTIPLAFFMRRLGERLFAPILIACTWVLLEWLRTTYVLHGFSWGVLGYALLDVPFLKYGAVLSRALGPSGVYVLSLMLVFGNLAVVEFVRAFEVRAGGISERAKNSLRLLAGDFRRSVAISSFVALVLSVGVYGFLHERTASLLSAPLRVAVIGSQLPTLESIDEHAYSQYRDRMNEAITRGAEIVVLPENAFPFFEVNEEDGSLNMQSFIRLEGQYALFEDFLALSRDHPSVTIVVGMHTIGKDGLRFNSAVFVEQGKFTAYYHKRKLVPFTEYAPRGTHLPMIEPLSAGVRDQYVEIFGMRSSALVCSEVGDTTIPLHDVALIISPSNDSVYSGVGAALTQHQVARMRAIETGAYVLRAVKGGISSIIDPKGNVLALGRDGVLIADVR